ncbi:MAG: putative porin [Flavobacteriaceae bacterium]|nr:putative porin [Flavobacteriaceae bacterium]
MPKRKILGILAIQSILNLTKILRGIHVGKLSILMLLCLFASESLFAQIPIGGNRRFDTGGGGQPMERGEFRKTKNKEDRPEVSLYKIISHDFDTTYVDTSLHIRKEYKLNYRRKDNFEYLEFANVGQPYNALSYNFEKAPRLYPGMGFSTKHQNIKEIEDIEYYYVPTPLTELLYKSVVEQGQVLDAFIAVNTSPRFNFSIGFKGLRSLGNFQNTLTSNGIFTFTGNYRSKTDRYRARFHVVAHDFLNEENGGLTEEGLNDFKGDVSQFQDRARLPVQFEDAESFIDVKRAYLEHSYKLFDARIDSLKKSSLTLGHTMTVQGKFYTFEQDQANAFFGTAFSARVRDRVDQNDFTNEFSVLFSNPTFGEIKGKISTNIYEYVFQSVTQNNAQTVPGEISGTIVSAGGSWKKSFGKMDFEADGMLNISGDFDGNYLTGKISYPLDSLSKVEASLQLNSKAPDYTAQLFQSDYTAYNWQNNFSNIKTQSLHLGLKSEKWADISITASRIEDYVYFANTSGTQFQQIVKPFQADEDVTFIKISAFKEFRYKNLALANTLLYQNVSQGEAFLRVPDFVSRNTLYYTNRFFKKALFVQTGFTLHYFSDYFANEYNPILGEFFIQDETEIGFPRVDFFLNFKVRQARIFFKFENFNAGNDGFSSPLNPYRDSIIRFGVVWNFFT